MNEANKQIFWLDESIHIPSGYEIIDGVKNTDRINGAYINTHQQLVEKSCKIEGYALMQYATGDWHVILGAETADNSDDSIKIRRRGDHNAITVSLSNANATYVNVDLNKWFYFCIDRGEFTLNETVMEYSPTEKLCPELFIGNQNINGKTYAGRYWVGAIGAIKLYNEKKLVGQFIPVKRLSDNVCGFYDTVTKQFMPSLTTNQFAEWNES